MHKRIIPAALGLALGLIGTAAHSGTYDFDRNTWSAGSGEQSSSARHQRVAYAYRADGDDDSDSVEPMRRRSITHGHERSRASRRGGGASASRSCLKPAARALLGRIEAQFGKMQIISTCRPGARIAGTGKRSKHATGEAIDFNAGGRKGAVVRWLIANHKSGGTMTYRGMSHIHVDVGYHFVSLNSRSGR